jgi:hypothetical protein
MKWLSEIAHVLPLEFIERTEKEFGEASLKTVFRDRNRHVFLILSNSEISPFTHP